MGGRQQWAASPVIDPSTGEVFDTLARGTAADIDKAVAAARAALSGPWSRLTATDRGRILMKMSQIMLEREPPVGMRKPWLLPSCPFLTLGRFVQMQICVRSLGGLPKFARELVDLLVEDAESVKGVPAA